MYDAKSVVSSALFRFLLFMAFFLYHWLENAKDFDPNSSTVDWLTLDSLFWSYAASSLAYFSAWDCISLILSSAHLQRHIRGRIKLLQWLVNFFFL